MRCLWSVLIMIVLAIRVAHASNIISTVDNNKRQRTGKTHTLELRCDVGINKIKISRLAIFDVPDAKDLKLDFAITTAHGLVDSGGAALENCRVHDFKGRKYSIKSIKVAKNYLPGTSTDWAMLTFDRASKSNVVRYNLASPLNTRHYDEMAEARLPLVFSSARGLPDGNQSCQAIPRGMLGMNSPSYIGLLPHNCRVISGQSGAPLSIIRQSKNVIMGFHVGQAFWTGLPHKLPPAKHGYMRVMDDILIAKINANVSLQLDRSKIEID